MKEENKRRFLEGYCSGTACRDCVLKHGGWENTTTSQKCLNLAVATEEELNRAIAIIMGAEAKLCGEVVEPEAQLEQVVEDADTVIKIKSSRAIESVTVYFREELGDA